MTAFDPKRTFDTIALTQPAVAAGAHYFGYPTRWNRNWRPMLQIATALLALMFAVFNVSEAMRTGRVQADFSHDNKRDRLQEPLAFWFFTLVWSAIALLFLAGISAVAASSVFGLGKLVPATFWHVTWKQWPWGIIVIGLLYLIVAKVRDRSENDA